MSSEFETLEREVVDHLFVLQPSYAVALGLHEYDGRLPDFSTTSTDRWVRDAEALLARLAQFSSDALPPSRKADAFLLSLLLESPLFDLRDVGDLERNPMNYLGAVSLTAYLARDYAPVPHRVEAVVRSHPDVMDAIVVGAPDERWGQRVAVIVEPRAGHDAPSLESVQEHCRRHVAGYKVPRELHVVERVERAPSGKPDYRWANAVVTGASV